MCFTSINDYVLLTMTVTMLLVKDVVLTKGDIGETILTTFAKKRKMSMRNADRTQTQYERGQM